MIENHERPGKYPFKIMKKSKRAKNRFLKFLLLSGLAALITAAVFMAVYGYAISRQIDKRFSARRWSLPSRVYSDTLLLYPGQQFKLSAILDKLARLGYHKVLRAPEKKGEYACDKKALTVYLHDLKTPEQNEKGFPVRLVFQNDQIVSITKNSDGTPIGLLELEPEEIMLFFGPERERRQLISIDQVPKHVIHAVLAAEDAHFYSHQGMDYRGILRAIYVNLRHASIRQGGSTISQQLIKSYFLTPERSYSRKLKELCMSLIMEYMYEKDEILEIYLNEIYLGQKGSSAISGIGEASFFYFDKPVSDLSVAEAAAIAGLIRGPNRYSPYKDANRCKIRRNQVLAAMCKNGWIDEKQLRQSTKAPLAPAGYQAYGKKARYFMDYLTEQLKTLYSANDLSSLGLSIYTTLDTEVQNAAEKALEKGLSRLEGANPGLKNNSNPESRLQGVVIVMQPQTGNILAMAGGRDYSISQFNRAVHARRQPGSAFKPFVYTAGLDQYTPASLLSNIEKTYDIDGTVWTPKNSSEFPQTHVRMRTALAKSINVPTVDLAMHTGMDKIRETSKAFGFSTFTTIYPSIALGAMPVIPLELARAYCPFAANGILPFPLSLKEVADEKNQLLQRRHTQTARAVSPEKAFLINSMLQSVVNEGTAVSLKKMGITYPVCGKTGTSNDNRDAWFIGFTPDVLALVWVGFDNGASISASGARAALPIWADLMSQLPQYVSGNSFTMPPGVTENVICPKSGMLAVENRCPDPVKEFFLTGHAPNAFCSEHRTHNPFKQVIDGFKDVFNP